METEKIFLKKLKLEGGRLLDKIKTANGKTMIYYQNYGSFPYNTNTKVF